MPNSRLDELERSGEELAVARSSLAERAAERLREWILLGKLPPGQILSERELSERLQVSRTPLREAIRLVANEELIEMQPNRRPRVADPPLERLRDLFEVQAALESLAGRLFVERASDEALATVIEIQRRLQETSNAPDVLEFFKLDMAFHRAIVEGAGNSALAETHRQYNAALFRARFMSSRQMRWRDVTMAQHDAIVEALIARDAQAADMALTAHLQRGKANVATLLSELASEPKQKRKQKP
ncbi:GntR family transcriptional regulator [Sinorhizobium sp. BG8]|uniref:GntR family transcriptional regulator n=1 Tax=Sinorhizobium sp. BG8 TaxID=2613773 RepID=UPI00193D52B9|nr:GntR family transcriptional regulator [Sinorhizobium sp. BG8]